MIDIILQCILNGLVLGSIYTLVALGLTLIFGIFHLPNFAHGALFMLGAYVTLFTITILGFDFFSAMAISIISIISFSLAMYYLVIRPLRKAPQLSVAIASLGVYIILEQLALLSWGPWYRICPPAWRGVIFFLNIGLSYHELLTLILTPIIVVGLCLFMYKTKLGTAVRAVAQDREAAALMGINFDKIYVIIFSLAGTLAAVAGSLGGAMPGQVVYPFMGFGFLITAFVVVMVGGMGSIHGAIVGGYILGLIEGISGGLFGGYLPIIGTGYTRAYQFIALIIILLIKPSGLFGEVLR